MTARLMTLVVASVAAVVLAGCTTPADDPPTSSSSPPPPVRQRPKDRDGEAVLAALRRIDLCAVLEAARNATPALPATAELTARQPFECTVHGLPRLLTSRVLGFVHEERVRLPVRVIGGAKAYVREARDRCALYLPVSFTRAIEFSQSGSCEVVNELVAASVAVLADPEKARVDPRWDGCAALAEALGPDADRSQLVAGDLADCTYLAGEKEERATLSFASSLPPQGQPRTTTIAGTTAQIYEDDEDCDILWRQRPFTSRFARAPDYPVRLFSLNCDYSSKLAEALIGVLADPAPAGTPQHPLLYAPDEPDGPFLGACAYVEDEAKARECEPYREVPVPDDLTRVSDAQVMCAASADFVREHFGDRLRPVAVSDADSSCHFVEPERETVLTFTVRGGLVAGDPGGREVTVAGHPGFVTNRDRSSYEYEVSTSDTPTEKGLVKLTVSTGPLADLDAPLPAGADGKAEAVLADILETY